VIDGGVRDVAVGLAGREDRDTDDPVRAKEGVRLVVVGRDRGTSSRCMTKATWPLSKYTADWGALGLILVAVGRTENSFWYISNLFRYRVEVVLLSTTDIVPD
jgi:hypothetical protein